jgi:hypothetical protein
MQTAPADAAAEIEEKKVIEDVNVDGSVCAAQKYACAQLVYDGSFDAKPPETPAAFKGGSMYTAGECRSVPNLEALV